MSDLVFPAFPAMRFRLTGGRTYKTNVQEAASGVETRTRLRTSMRRRWEVTVMARNAAAITTYHTTGSVYASYTSEFTCLTTFFDLHVGRWDSFLLDSPEDGVRRRVRFDADELDPEVSVPHGVWTFDFDLIEVL